MEDFGEFLRLDFVQGFAAGLELFEGFNDGLRHAVVGFGGTTDDGKLLTGGETFVPVGVVKAKADETGFRGAGFARFAHARTVAG